MSMLLYRFSQLQIHLTLTSALLVYLNKIASQNFFKCKNSWIKYYAVGFKIKVKNKKLQSFLIKVDKYQVILTQVQGSIFVTIIIKVGL